MATTSPGSRGDGNTVERRVSDADETTLTNAVVEAIAAAGGGDPTDVEFRLYEYVDPEVLTHLARRAESDDGLAWTVTFAIEGLEVTVSCDDGVCIVAGRSTGS